MAVSKKKISKKEITLNNYKLSEKDPFMCEEQLIYFKLKLEKWRSEVMADSEKTRENLQNNNTPEADVADRASTETERSLELRTRDRQRKLLAKINAALARIKEGSYGCLLYTSPSPRD